jgi:hypothetical protein
VASISRGAPIHLGLDVHKDTISVGILPADQQVPQVERIAHDEASIRRLVGRLGDPRRLRACYEAGPTGSPAIPPDAADEPPPGESAAATPKGDQVSEVTTYQAPHLTDEQIDHILQAMADSFGQQPRSPIMHSPSEQDLDYEDVTFPSLDGVPLEGWFIPAIGSDRLISANHPMGFSRSGMPTHLEPWRSAWSSSGNDFEVNLVPDYKILHDVGYNVLAYDLRNSGHSGAANGGIASSGIFESRDVLGSLHTPVTVRTRGT